MSDLIKVKIGGRSFLCKWEPSNVVEIGGKRYPVVQIGRQWWMAENLDYAWEGLPTTGGHSKYTAYAMYPDNNETMYGYDGKRYGLMYNFMAMRYLVSNTSAFPENWHIPTRAELTKLVNAAGGDSVAGGKLKSSTKYDGTDDYGFSMVPAGLYYNGTAYDSLENNGYLWAAEEYNSSSGYTKKFVRGSDSVTFDDPAKTAFNSIRLCKDATVSIGGRDYPTTRIGNQVWLAANLNWDADGLVEIRTSGTPTTPAAWYYDNNPENYGSNGLLYNWYSCQALQSVLPKGWRIPTKDDFDILVTAVGGPDIAGKNLKATSGWTQGNGSDLYGFSAIPAGNYYGYFNWIGTSNNIWTSEPESASSDRACTYGCGTYDRIFSDVDYKIDGCSIRLVKDAT